jgi:hypothetical protein
MDRDLLIVGAGVYGLVAMDIAKSMGCFRRITFIDDCAKETPNGIAVVGTTADIPLLAKDYGEAIESITVDEIVENFGKFTYLNIDVEGAEKEMLQGAKNTLQQYKPKLCMAGYHRSEDIFSLVNKINEINDDYKIFLRHHPHISFWDTNIYCI